MIDRALQKELLQKLKDCYVKGSGLTLKELETSQDAEKVQFNLKYLKGHGLIKSYSFGHMPIIRFQGMPKQQDTRKPEDAPISGEITVQGIDFLENDGGLTAILGVVTIKFHQDTLSELETMIQLDKTLPPDEKVTLLQKLRSLPEEGAKTLVQELVKAGLQKAPDGWNTAIHYLNNIPWGQTSVG